MTWLSIIVVLTAAAYFVSSAAFMVYLVSFQAKWSTFGYRMLLVGLSIHIIAVVHLFVGPEASSLVEPTAFIVALAMVLVFLVVERGLGGRIWATLLCPIATSVVLASLHGLFEESATAVPGFMAVVTPLHIGASTFGIGAFLVAFVGSALFVAQDYNLREKKSLLSASRMPAQTTLNVLVGRSLKIGFPLYTLGIVLGAFWAIKGDPPAFSARYIFAFISWLVYGLVIVGRLTTGWSGRRSAVFTMVGFLGAFSVVVGYMVRVGG